MKNEEKKIYHVRGVFLNLGFLTEGIRITPRRLAAAILLNSGTLAWFFLLIIYMWDISAWVTLDNEFWGYYNIGPSLFLGFAVLWSIIASFAGGKVDRRNFLISSVVLGTLSTIVLIMFQGAVLATISIFLMGMSFGFGLPNSMALVADYTAVEERARVSGAIILFAFLLAFASMAAIRIFNLEMSGIVLLLALLRSTSFPAFVIDKSTGQEVTNMEATRLSNDAYKQLALYLLPWVMFVVVSSMAWNLIPENSEAAAIGTVYRYILIAVFGFLSGVVADRFGRKQPIIMGLVVLGISFALLGFFGITDTNVIIYLGLSGIAWGSFFVLFGAIPGDLSVAGSREKFYGLGYILPVAVLVCFSVIPGRAALVGQSASLVSQIFSIILFLSIIPVLRARETLHESKIQERKMKEHVEKVGKTVQKL